MRFSCPSGLSCLYLNPNLKGEAAGLLRGSTAPQDQVDGSILPRLTVEMQDFCEFPHTLRTTSLEPLHRLTGEAEALL